MSTLPTKQIGILATHASYTLQEFPVPSPSAKEVLIQNIAVASNPKDYKLPAENDYAFIEGNDVAGIIAAVGEDVSEYKPGDRVAAFTKMRMKENKYGAYAQYSVAPASTTFPISEAISFEEAATLPLAVMTAAIGLFVVLGLPEPPSDASIAPSIGNGLIVYGASSSVGSYAVQLAKRAGFFVVGIAGSSGDYAKSIGADVVVDYRNKDSGTLEKEIVKALESYPTSAAFDAISEHGSTLTLGRALTQTSADGKGALTYVLHSFKDHDQLPEGIAAKLTYVGSAYLDDEDFASRFYRQISKYLLQTSRNPTPFKPNRVKLMPNGLASVPDGIDLLKNGKVHAEKLVYRIKETPGLSS